MMRALMAQALGDEGGGDPQQVMRRLAPYLRALALEYGQMPEGCEVQPHNVTRGPATDYLELASDGDTAEFDAVAQLGGKEAATRGHVANVGDNTLIIDWRDYSSDAWQGRYRLPAGGTLDLSSFLWRALRVEAVDGEGAAQIWAQ